MARILGNEYGGDDLVHNPKTIILLTLLFLILGCSPPDPYKIIFLGPLTGPNASLGVDGLKGAQLALLKFNNLGGLKGRSVELLILDDENDPAKGLEILKANIPKDLLGVILHTTSGASLEVIPYLNEKQIITFSRTVSTPKWSGLDDFFIRFSGKTEDFGREIGRMIAAQGVTDVAVAFESSNKTYSDSVILGIQNTLPTQVLRKEIYSFDSWEEMETSGKDSQLLSHLPKGILIIASGLNSAKAAQNLHRRGLKLPLFLTPWSHNQVLIQFAGDYASNISLLGTTVPNAANPAYLNFLEDFEKFYSQKPSNFAVFGYEVTQFFLNAVIKSPDLRGTSLKSTIIGSTKIQGLQDLIILDKFGDSTSLAYHLGIQEGGFYLKK